MAAWLYQPVMFDTGREFDCDGLTPDQCTYYKERWHNWYVADLTFSLPTVAFFMCCIGIFIIGYFLVVLPAPSMIQDSMLRRKGVAGVRYLSYRGFHITSLGWSSAPVGILSLGLLGAIYFFCMDLIPSPYYWPGTDDVWGDSPPLATRSGWLALACMPFIFATASKTSWITLLTGVTHEKLQVFHRWIAYAFFLLALMHTFPFIVWHIQNHDMVYQFNVSNIFEYWTGVVALIFQAWLTFASWGSIRSLGYEFFKAAHFFAVIIFMVVFFWHCAGTLTSWHYFVGTAAVYVPCWVYPWLRTLFEYGLGQRAQLFLEDNEFIRITIPAKFTWHPGQHCFLRFRSLGIHAFSSHPFTICSVPSRSSDKPSEIVFYVRHRGGLTARLYKLAKKQPGMQLPVLVDGPYGGINNQRYFESNRLVVIAGGSGAGWVLPLVEQFLQYRKLTSFHRTSGDIAQSMEKDAESSFSRQATSQLQSLRVVLATRESSSCMWFHDSIQRLLTQYSSAASHSDVDIQVHLTSAVEGTLHSNTKRISNHDGSTTSASNDNVATDHVPTPKALTIATGPNVGLHGRPDLPSIIKKEAASAATKAQRIGVFVCGPLTMQNDVRNAVARANLDILWGSKAGDMYLHLEHFSWA